MRPIRYALFALSVWLALPAGGADYYASPTGTAAAGTCTSSTCNTTACCSLANCAASITVAGDACYMRPGTYTNPPFIALNTICTASSPCLISAQNPGTNKDDPTSYDVIIEISSGTNYMWDVNGDYWTIRGMRVQAWRGTRFVDASTGGADGLTIEGNRFELRPGVEGSLLYAINSDDITIRGNWMANYPGCKETGDVVPAGLWGPGFTIGTCGSYLQCDWINNGGRFIAIEGQANTDVLIESNFLGHRLNVMQITNTTGIIIRRNWFQNVNNHGQFEINSVSDVLVENNITSWDHANSDCSDDGVSPATMNSSFVDSYCVSDLIVRNNTLVGHGKQNRNAGLWLTNQTNAYCIDGYAPSPGSGIFSNIYLYNNILHDQATAGTDPTFHQIAPAANFAGGVFLTAHNIFGRIPTLGVTYFQGGVGARTMTQWQTNSVGTDSVTEDIRTNAISTAAMDAAFVSYTGRNYRPINASSPIVNLGVDSGDGLCFGGSNPGTICTSSGQCTGGGTCTFPYACPTEDYDGNPRTDGSCDMGAFEFQGVTATRDFIVTNCSTDGSSTTEGDLDWAIAQVNALPVGGPSSITFNCPSGSIMQVTSTDFNNRVLSQPSLTINGGDLMTFEMTPQWFDLSLCAQGVCDSNADNLPEQCPTVGDGTTNMWVFRITGANITLKDFTYRYFMEGIRGEGANYLIDGVTGEYPGDESFSNPGGFNGTIQNSTFRNACDKNLQLYGDETLGTSTFDSTILNNTFENSSSAVRTSGASAAGRHYFEGNTFTSNSPPSSLFTDRGPYFGDDTPTATAAIHWKNNTVRATNRGLRLSGGVQFFSLGGNLYDNNDLRGLSVHSNARALITADIFTGNGGSSTGGDPIAGYGGIAVGNTAIVDAGGGPGQTIDGATRASGGGNLFTGNFSATDSALDFHNLSGTTMFATNNCWTNNANVADSITGSVTFNPIGTCGSSTTNSTLRGFRISGGTVR